MLHPIDVRPGLRWAARHHVLWCGVAVALLPLTLLIGAVRGMAEALLDWRGEMRMCRGDCWCRRLAETEEPKP